MKPKQDSPSPENASNDLTLDDLLDFAFLGGTLFVLLQPEKEKHIEKIYSRLYRKLQDHVCGTPPKE